MGPLGQIMKIEKVGWDTLGGCCACGPASSRDVPPWL